MKHLGLGGKRLWNGVAQTFLGRRGGEGGGRLLYLVVGLLLFRTTFGTVVVVEL